MFMDLWQERVNLVEKQLLVELLAAKSINQTIEDSMKYSLMAGGKRLRPVMLMAAADTVGADGTKFITTACALEMIHTYSLIHDDLPAMDNDDYRRGKLTNHKVFGEGMAVLAGDALLTLAFEVMCRQQGVSSDVLVKVIKDISIAAGAAGMGGGQALDLESENKHIPMELLKKMHMGKTGALFRTAICSGAMLAGASDRELELLTDYAEQFGLAFQITDDILDVVGDSAVIGKPVGSDERNNKSTYVTLTSLEEARRLAQEAVDKAIVDLEPFGEKADFLRELVKYLINRKK